MTTNGTVVIRPPFVISMRRLLMLLAVASLFFIAVGSIARAQSPISVADTSLKVDYPKTMTFHLAASSAAPITTVELLVRFPASNLVSHLKPTFTSGAKVDTSVAWNLRGENASAVGGYLPPGATGQYTWHIEDQAGNKFDTPAQSFRVDDNRETWKNLSNDKITLYWYDGDQSFGQQIFDTANKTLAAIQNDEGATLSNVQIFIYSDRQEFLSTLAPGNHEWAGGTIDETFSIVLINASANDLDYALTTTPHELTHLVTHAALKGPYSQIAMPLWMDEGLAVYHEFVPPQDEPRFEAALRRGIQTDTLFRLRSLDSNFPNDASVVDMAYGEGYSVVDFMIHTYGRDKIKQVIDLFRAGTTPDDAFQKVLGVDEDGLENAWRQSIGAQTKNYAKPATATPGAVPTLAFSSAATPSGAKTTPTTVALQATPAPVQNSTPTPASSSGGGGMCGGLFGGMGLVAFGVWRLKRRYPASS